MFPSRLRFWALACSLLAPWPCTQAAEKPNIIFILADDMGAGDMSHTGGLAATPHIDRLAADGICFTDAHTSSSVCTPTRYSILTGRYNWRSTLKEGVLFGYSPPLIPPSRMTVASLLSRQGYQTGVVGKWHLGLDWQTKAKAEGRARKVRSEDIDYTRKVEGGPLALGFDRSFLLSASLDMPPFLYLRNDLATGIPTATKSWLRSGPATPEFEASQCLTDFAREARSFISDCAAQKEKPFFLYLPLTSPHTPIVPSEKWRGKSKIGPYGDFLMETDWVVGEVLAELDRQGIADHTMVVFTADNGCSPAAKIPALEEQGHHPNAAWRGHKADIYEGGHRVPFVVRWPETAKAGSTCGQTIGSIDFLATVADILDAPVPPNAAEDSFSILPLLKDPGHTAPIRPFTIHHSIDGSFAIREGPWKLALCPGSGGWSKTMPKVANRDPSLPPVQLFDLQADPAEQHNLVADHPDKVADLVAKLAKAIRDGRTTPGEPQPNDGNPDTFLQRVVDAYPALDPGKS